MVAASPSFADSVLASLGSGILAVDLDGCVALANEEARRLLAPAESTARDLLGRDCRELLAEEPKLLQLLLAACRRRGRLTRAELPLERTRGEITIGVSFFGVRHPDGGLAGAALLFRDLAPIERLEEQQRLQGRLAALGQMAAGLAHEIRNPLASMEVLAGLLRRRMGERSEEREFVDQLISQLRDVAKIVSTSLEFVRPQAVRRSRRAPVELVESALRRALPRHGAAPPVETHFEPSLPEICVDEEEITTALANLIGNACEALTLVPEELRRLTLRVASGPGEIVIAIADSGPGVPADLHEKIFYPFFTTRAEGSGIGLASAQKAVASHGGSIELDGRPGKGATFRVHLPIEETFGGDPGVDEDVWG